MEAARRKFDRLLGALDDLVTQEAATLQARDFDSVVAIGQRADPVVAGLAELAPEVADDLARAKVAGLLARRQHNMDFLETQLVTAREELLALSSSMRRVSRLVPAYAKAEGLGAPSRFSAAG